MPEILDTPAFLLHNNLCEFKALEHKFKIRFKNFWYPKLNPTQIWYDKFNYEALKVQNSLHTQHVFLTFYDH